VSALFKDPPGVSSSLFASGAQKNRNAEASVKKAFGVESEDACFSPWPESSRRHRVVTRARVKRVIEHRRSNAVINHDVAWSHTNCVHSEATSSPKSKFVEIRH
jgi:hypothetical protein